MMQYCEFCGETRCARVDAECKRPCVSAARFMTPAEYHAQFAQQRESIMVRNVFDSATSWLNASPDPITQADIQFAWRTICRPQDQDPDGPLVPLPPKPAPFREFEPQKHDFIGALYRPYVPIA